MKKCPRNRFKNCIESECALYIELYEPAPEGVDRVKVGKCADAWVPMLSIENTQAIQTLQKTISGAAPPVAMTDNANAAPDSVQH